MKKQDVINYINSFGSPPKQTVTYSDLLVYIGFSNGDKLIKILKELIDEGAIVETEDEEYQLNSR